MNTETKPTGSSTATAKEEHEANARLIAAAPELLEALEDYCANGHSKPLLERARAAIKKATTLES